MGTPILEPGFEPGLHDIRHVIDMGLLSRRDILGDGGAKAWRASSLGYCLRRQLFERAGVPRTKSDGGLRTLWLGDMIHHGVQKMIVDAGLMLSEEITLTDDELNLSGHVDLVWGGQPQKVDYDALSDRYGVFWADFVVNYRSNIELMYAEAPVFPVTMTEFKSANQYSAERAYADGVSFHHGVQAGGYRLMAERHPEIFPQAVQELGGIERFQVTMLAKSDLMMPVFDIQSRWVDTALERLALLNQCWAEGILPPCTCGVEIKWEKRYCAYRHADDEGKKDPRCCMPDLLNDADPAFWLGLPDEASEAAQRAADEEEVLPKGEA